jgi:hypothetical protein
MPFGASRQSRRVVPPSPDGRGAALHFGVAIERKIELTATISSKHLSESVGKIPSLLPYGARSRPQSQSPLRERSGPISPAAVHIGRPIQRKRRQAAAISRQHLSRSDVISTVPTLGVSSLRLGAASEPLAAHFSRGRRLVRGVPPLRECRIGKSRVRHTFCYGARWRVRWLGRPKGRPGRWAHGRGCAVDYRGKYSGKRIVRNMNKKKNATYSTRRKARVRRPLA